MKSFFAGKSLSAIVRWLTVFLLFLGYFFFSIGWYEPAKFIVEGRTADTEAKLCIQWDSGAGYNSYEQRTFQFLKTRSKPGKKHEIVVKVAEPGGLERGKRIVLAELRVDGHGVHIPQSALRSARRVKGAGVFLETAESELRLDIPAQQHIFFLFKSNQSAGTVDISIDGQHGEYNLFTGNWAVLFSRIHYWLLRKNGLFTVNFALPRYGMDTLRLIPSPGMDITSLFVQTSSARQEVEFTRQQDGSLRVRRPNAHLKHFFHPVQFCFQIFFALLMTTLVMSVGRALGRCGGLKQCFFADGRSVFWGFFLATCGVYSLWLAAFWPGVLSLDSLAIWRAAWLPEIMINNHPLINMTWYMLLLHLWNNCAVVPLVQILLLSLLLSHTLLFCYRRGVKLPWLIGCWLLPVLSVPVGVYNITLWKDIPFALLVVFWSLASAWLYYQKKDVGRISLPAGSWILFVGLFFALLLFRHNGIIYLVGLPLLLVVIRVIRIHKTGLLISILLISSLFTLVLFPPKFFKGASYFHDLSLTYLHQIHKVSIGSRIRKSIGQYPRLLDLKKNNKQTDFWHYYLGDRYAYQFLRDSGWSDSFRYLPYNEGDFSGLRGLALKIYKTSLKYPWVYLSWNSFWLLYLFPLSIVLYRRFPLSAIFSTVVLMQVVALLVVVGSTNWRYYYFVLLSGYFLLPVLLLDRLRYRQQNR